MNRIYKSIWSAVRRCFVVVSEAQKALKKNTKSKAVAGTLLAVVASSAFAQTYRYDDSEKDYVVDTISDAETIQIVGAKSVTINSINSPDAYLVSSSSWAIQKPEGVNGNELTKDYFNIPVLRVNENVTVGSLNIESTNAYIKGDVNVAGQVPQNFIDLALTPSGDNTKIIPVGTSGFFRTGSNKDFSNGVTIDGNVTADVVANYGGQWVDSDANDYFATLVVKGNLTTRYLFTDTGWGYDDKSDYLEVQGTIHVSATFINNGYLFANNVIVDGEFHNGYGSYVNSDGEIDPDAVAPTERTGAVISSLDAKNIYNRSNLEVGSFVNTRDQVYNQSFGTIKATDNWFENSVINLSGGIIDEAYLGPDHNLGINNVFNVTGGTLKVSDLNFDSEVNLSAEGKIETALESIFVNPEGDPEALNYVGLNAQAPETVKQSLTKWFTNYVAGTLRQDLEDHVNFEGGSIVISGVKMTETQYNDLMKAFKEAFLYPVYPSFSIDNSQIQRGHFTFKNWGVEEF